jgi:hypothetical protein
VGRGSMAPCSGSASDTSAILTGGSLAPLVGPVATPSHVSLHTGQDSPSPTPILHMGVHSLTC